MSYKIGAFKISAKFPEHMCWIDFLIQLQAFRTSETPARVFSGEFCENFNNTFFQNNSRRLLLHKILKISLFY